MRQPHLFFASLLQGASFLIYPASAELLADPSLFGLTSEAYGSLFIPMLISALLSALYAGQLETLFGLKGVYLLGNLCNALSLLVFSLSALSLNICPLIISTTLLGLGYGAITSVATPYMGLLYPKTAHLAVMVIFTLFILGATLCPLYVYALYRGGYWWVAPLLLSSAFAGVLLVGSISLEKGRQRLLKAQLLPKGGLPFVIAMFLYGLTSTVYSNWIIIYLVQEKGQKPAVASLALTLFWGAILFGRLFTIWLKAAINFKLLFRLSPYLVALSLILLPLAGSTYSILALTTFAGLAFSTIFPFIFSYGNARCQGQEVAISGAITAAFILGFGVAAFGVGYIDEQLSLSLGQIFALSSIFAVFMGGAAYSCSSR